MSAGEGESMRRSGGRRGVNCRNGWGGHTVWVWGTLWGYRGDRGALVDCTSADVGAGFGRGRHLRVRACDKEEEGGWKLMARGGGGTG